MVDLVEMLLIKVNVGLDTAVGGNGWGAGGLQWSKRRSVNFWLGRSAASGTTATVRVWSHDNFGEDLLLIQEMVVSFIGIKPMALVQEPWLSLL